MPARSVYHFCGNNPLLLVDGNGMSYDDYRDIPPYRWEDDSGLNSDPRPHTIIFLKSRGWEKRYVRGWDPTPWYSDDASSHSNPADLRDMTNILSTTSVLMSVFGGLTENSKATFRITNSKGVFDFKFYRNGWGGNQWITPHSISKIGKDVRYLGKVVGLVGIGMSGIQFIQAATLEDQVEHGLDMFMGGLSFIPIFGTGISLYRSLGGKYLHYLWVDDVLIPQMEMEIIGMPATMPFK